MKKITEELFIQTCRNNVLKNRLTKLIWLTATEMDRQMTEELFIPKKKKKKKKIPPSKYMKFSKMKGMGI